MQKKSAAEIIKALQAAYDENNNAMGEIHSEMVRVSNMPESELTERQIRRLSAAEEALRQAREYAGACLRNMKSE